LWARPKHPKITACAWFCQIAELCMAFPNFAKLPNCGPGPSIQGLFPASGRHKQGDVTKIEVTLCIKYPKLTPFPRQRFNSNGNAGTKAGSL
ncbi:hypothetical protein DUNSADRAFT_17264, partial [Dunaliella salina]